MSASSYDGKGSPRSVKEKFFDRLWNDEPTELTRFRRALHALFRVAFLVARDFVGNVVKLQAMALAFKTLLSLAPLLAVVFSILKAFGVHNRMEPALAEALAPLGEKGQEITQLLIGFVDRMSAGALGSVGLVTLFVTVLSLMGTIEEAFNTIWRVSAPRKLARKFSDYLSVLLVGPVLIFAALTITATLQSNTFVQNLISLEPFGTVVLALLKLVPYVTLWGAFTFFYIFIPNTRVNLKSALIGGLVAAVLWQTVGWAFTVFVASSTRYYAIYSSFAILLLFLLWLHIGWLIVLLGAQVAYAHQHVNFYQVDRDGLFQSPAGREKIALHLLYAIGRNFYLGIDPVSVGKLAAELRLPAGPAKDILELLCRSRLLLAAVNGDTYVLARDPQTINLKEILDSVRNAGGNPSTRLDRGQAADEINELLMDVEDSVAQALEGRTLQGLVVSQLRG
jgi:membrane protein